MVARASRSFGCTDLVLVGGVATTHPQALAAAAGAGDVLSAARQVKTLAEALEGAALAIATTARPYDRPDLRALPVRVAAGRAPADAAWVFGTEKHGLTLLELQQCHLVASILSAGPSLNLAQAVAICLYEAFAAGAEPRPAGRPAAEILGDAGPLAGALKELGVATDRDAASKAHTLRRIAAGLSLDEHEAALLKAVWAKATKKNKGRPEAAGDFRT